MYIIKYSNIKYIIQIKVTVAAHRAPCIKTLKNAQKTECNQHKNRCTILLPRSKKRKKLNTKKRIYLCKVKDCSKYLLLSLTKTAFIFYNLMIQT
jgi:hypothetical protein